MGRNWGESMTGLKTGAGDDLWGDDEEDEEASEKSVESQDQNPTQEEGQETQEPQALGEQHEQEQSHQSATEQPYIIRRAVQNKSIQFERNERLTFYVHDDVVAGERELLSEVEAALGREVPKFDIREAVYRAALNNREDVLAQLVQMGYTIDDD